MRIGPRLRVGQRVRILNPVSLPREAHINGIRSGIILDVGDFECQLILDGTAEQCGGHNADGRGPVGRCWWVAKAYVKLAEVKNQSGEYDD